MSEQTPKLPFQTPEKPQTVADLRSLLGKAYSEGASEEVVANLEAKLLTVKQAEVKAQAEQAKVEVAAKQAERQVIVDDCKDWVKHCKKIGCPIITVNLRAILDAKAIMELLKTQPDIVDRVAAAKGTSLQFKPAHQSESGEWDSVAQAIVTVPGTKVTAKRGGDGANRGGKLIALFEQFASQGERDALNKAVADHKAAGGTRPDGIEYKHRVDVKKRCLSEGLIVAE